MEIGGAFFAIAILIIAIWIIVEIKRLRHKMFAIFLIALILFTYLSFASVISKENVDFKTMPGIISASKLYFSWLGSVFGNIKSITSHTIKLDWQGNATIPETKEIEKFFGEESNGFV